jgi:hypothetical protein
VLYLIDVLAALFALIGFQLAFRQQRVRGWAARLRPPPEAAEAEPGALTEDPEGVAAVFRMVGVMVMAFSITAAAFANLIAHYASAGAH